MPSPTPMKRKGFGHWRAIAASTPPLAVPSSLVTTRPVTPIALSKALTCASAFWPMLASSTSSTSCGPVGSALATTRRTLAISSIRWSWVGSRPAVSASTTSILRARAALIASKITAAESPPSCATTVTLLRSPQVINCSRAAARKVSPAASSTLLPWAWKYLASLPIEVVFPEPLTPAIMMMKGWWPSMLSGSSSGAMISCRPSASACWSWSAVSRRSRFQRRRRSSIRCWVASTPQSAISRVDSSSSSRSSSILRRPNRLARPPPSCWRVRARPALRRSVHDFLGAAAGAAGSGSRANSGSRAESPSSSDDTSGLESGSGSGSDTGCGAGAISLSASTAGALTVSARDGTSASASAAASAPAETSRSAAAAGAGSASTGSDAGTGVAASAALACSGTCWSSAADSAALAASSDLPNFFFRKPNMKRSGQRGLLESGHLESAPAARPTMGGCRRSR